MFINEKIIKDELYLCKEKEKKLEKEIRHFEKELRRLEKQDAEWIERNIELLKMQKKILQYQKEYYGRHNEKDKKNAILLKTNEHIMDEDKIQNNYAKTQGEKKYLQKYIEDYYSSRLAKRLSKVMIERDSKDELVCHKLYSIYRNDISNRLYQYVFEINDSEVKNICWDIDNKIIERKLKISDYKRIDKDKWLEYNFKVIQDFEIESDSKKVEKNRIEEKMAGLSVNANVIVSILNEKIESINKISKEDLMQQSTCKIDNFSYVFEEICG